MSTGYGVGRDPGDAHAYLTVGELAQLAGVTARTVRHYHSIGLLAEPARDSSNYRRYGAAEVVALVRIVRLRAVGMPLSQIATVVASGRADTDGEPSLERDLRALAAELDREIVALQTTRDRLRDLADSETFDRPVRALTHALRAYGVLGPFDELGEGEESVASLLDALHPDGMAGVLARATGLLDDPAANALTHRLMQRFRGLDDRTDDAAVDALAAEVAVLLPRRRRRRAAALDVELMNKLLAGQLNGAQRRFMDRLQRTIADPDGARPRD